MPPRNVNLIKTRKRKGKIQLKFYSNADNSFKAIAEN